MKPFDDCEHEWQATEVNFNQVDTVTCTKCHRIEHRNISYFVSYPNKRFPIDRYPLIFTPEMIKQLVEKRSMEKLR